MRLDTTNFVVKCWEVLVQCVESEIRFLLFMFKYGAGRCFLQVVDVPHILNTCWSFHVKILLL